MRKNGRFSVAVFSVVLLLVTLFTTPVALAQDVNAVLAEPVQADVKITLEDAITIVKTNFEVPEKYTDFNTGFNTYTERQAWSLSWNEPEGKSGYVTAEVDAVTGDILNMNRWQWSGQKDPKAALPAVSKEDAQKAGDELVARLLGERANNLKLIPNEQEIVPISYYGSEAYSFQYQRLINDVPFLNNGVYIQVSKTDGNVISYNLSWSDVQAPVPTGIIGLSQAESAFSQSPAFKLRYFLPSDIRPLAAGEAQKREAKLVYELTGPNGGAIDAFTGEPIKLDSGIYLAVDQNSVGAVAKEEMSAGRGSADGNVALTPQEQKEVELSGQLLKQEDAIAAVKKWVEVPVNLALRSVSLSRDYQNAELRYWNLEWSKTDSEYKEGEATYFSATVNAVDGEVVNFHSAYAFSGPKEAALDQVAAQKLAEDFLRKIQPEKFNQVTIIDEANSYKVMITPEPWGTKYFSYQRVVNGIDFPENSLFVGVDPVSGRITDYSYNWSNFELPGLEGVLSKDEGVKVFLGHRSLTLAYVQTYAHAYTANGVSNELKLVYLPYNQDRSVPTSNIMDAKNGALLDYRGNPIQEGPKPYNFIDLIGVKGAQEIAALGKAGLFGDFGSSFKAKDLMTAASLLRAMYLYQYGLSGNTSLTDEEILSKARELGWVKEELQADDPINRELLTKVLLRYVNLNNLAELSSIYQVDFEDADQISPDAVGYIALARGTGILQVEGQILAPLDNVNRAEAALAFYRALSWLYNR